MTRLYALFARWRRPRRMRLFEQLLSPGRETDILDVGGTVTFWAEADRKVTLLNVDADHEVPEHLAYVQGDATNLPFPDNAFDIVFSNSMIEHLHTRERQELAAREAMRVGERLWVQTPNYWFPVEPHYLTPFVHWFPKRLQKRIVRNFTIWGLLTRPSQDDVDEIVDEITLLGAKELGALFPGCTIVRERFLGLTKSLVAVSPSDRDV